MKSRTEIWAKLLRELAAEGRPFLLRMTTSNGAEFDRMLPPLEAIGDITFAPEYEWPFEYDDIVSLELYDRTNPKTYMISYDYQRIQEIIKEVNGAKLTEVYRITVPSAT